MDTVSQETLPKSDGVPHTSLEGQNEEMETVTTEVRPCATRFDYPPMLCTEYTRL